MVWTEGIGWSYESVLQIIKICPFLNNRGKSSQANKDNGKIRIMLQRALKILNYSQRAEQEPNEVHEVVYIRKNANSLKPRFKMGELHSRRGFPTSGVKRTKMSELGWAHADGVGIDVQMDVREFFQVAFYGSVGSSRWPCTL